ncbi:MAG TPA: MaoC/PaaZ C-terminal domain-containing protein [Euzebyales bacterium]|nr:MaoC/PaaZ C-terminal domain-containing protein [Euzebyales bacterium]
MSDLQPGDQLPQRSVTLDQETLIRYAGVSGDFNPLHWDPAFAATLSPTGGVIAHGMLSMGLLSALLTDWLGDAGRVRSMSCQFRAACPVGATVTLGGDVTSVDDDAGTATLAIWVRLEDGSKVIDQRTSRAVVTR